MKKIVENGKTWIEFSEPRRRATMHNKPKFMEKIWYVCGFPRNGCGYFICKLPIKWDGNYMSLVLTQNYLPRVSYEVKNIYDFIKEEDIRLQKEKHRIGDDTVIGGILLKAVERLIKAKLFIR